MTECLRAAQALHDHLARRHLRDGSLAGPDYGVRLNYRVGRFVKSYLRRIPWRDNLVYEQAQGYWILACSRLQERDGRNRLELVERCADGILRRQRADGSWAYPNPAWRGRVATAEGTWAAIGLLEAAQLLDDDRPLAGAQAWHSFLEERIGFRAVDGGLAVNYFAGRPGGAVPNNSAFVLRFLAGLARATGNDGHLARCRELIAFLASIQRPTGELPYSVPHSATEGGTEHFQCIQYNAFQCLDLIRYSELSDDGAARGIAGRIAGFLAANVRPDGRVPYACDSEFPEVTYHHAAAAAGLRAASRIGVEGCAGAAAPVLRRVLARQRDDGSFPHSTRDYRLLSDRRSYPRSQAMVLHHLLEPASAGGP